MWMKIRGQKSVQRLGDRGCRQGNTSHTTYSGGFAGGTSPDRAFLHIHLDALCDTRSHADFNVQNNCMGSNKKPASLHVRWAFTFNIDRTFFSISHVLSVTMLAAKISPILCRSSNWCWWSICETVRLQASEKSASESTAVHMSQRTTHHCLADDLPPFWCRAGYKTTQIDCD